jgi:hypothetical protein
MKESKIPKFRRCVLQNFPFIEEDFDALTDYELLCKVVEYLNKVIDHQNAVDEKIDGLVEGFAELKAYVDNYFDNLDVQEEINNKLEDMAEGGELAGIIAQFLEIAPVFGYGTIAKMAASDNLSNGCIARVLGNTSATAGDGAFYSIRTRIETDNPDGVNLVAIGDTLVGVRIQDAAINDLQNQIDELVEPAKKYLFVGDSYADGYTPDGNVTPWQSIVKTKLGLTDAQFVTTHQGGFGFGRAAEYNYYTLIAALSDDSTITDIVIGGSYNDQDSSEVDITSGIANVRTLCKTKFPNAKLHIAFIGWSKNANAKTNLQLTYLAYKNGCDAYADIDFMKNTQYALHDYFTMFSSDGIHPNLNGQTAIANAIVDCINNGLANIYYRKPIGFDLVNNGGLQGTWTGKETVDNGITSIMWDNDGTMNWTTENAITLSGKSFVKVGTFNSGLVVGDNSYEVCGMTPCVVQTTDNVYHSVMFNFAIKDGGLYIANALINSEGTNYDTMNIKIIQCGAINITVPTIVA